IEIDVLEVVRARAANADVFHHVDYRLASVSWRLSLDVYRLTSIVWRLSLDLIRPANYRTEGNLLLYRQSTRVPKPRIRVSLQGNSRTASSHVARPRAHRCRARVPTAHDGRRAARDDGSRGHLWIADARHVHSAAGTRALRGEPAGRPRPCPRRSRAWRVRPDASGVAGSFRLGVGSLGTQARHRRGPRGVRARKLRRRMGAVDRLDDCRAHDP